MARAEGSLQERWRGAFLRAWSDRGRGDGFTVTERRVGLDNEKYSLL